MSLLFICSFKVWFSKKFSIICNTKVIDALMIFLYTYKGEISSKRKCADNKHLLHKNNTNVDKKVN